MAENKKLQLNWDFGRALPIIQLTQEEKDRIRRIIRENWASDKEVWKLARERGLVDG